MSGEILNHPSIVQKIKSGEIDFDFAKKTSQQILSKDPSLAKSYGFVDQANFVSKNKNDIDESRNNLIISNKIVQEPELIKKINSGEIDIDFAVKTSNILRKQNPSKYKEDGSLTSAKETAEEPLSLPEDSVINETQSLDGVLSYIGEEALSGLTFGISDVEAKPSGLGSAAIGFAANMIGSIPSGLALSALLGPFGAFGALGRKAQTAYKSYKFLKGVYKTGKNVRRARNAAIAYSAVLGATEGAAAGFISGGVKSGIRGEDLSTILSNAVEGANQFAVAGAVLGPAFTVAGANAPAITRRGRRVKKLGQLARENETVQGTIKKSIPSNYKAQLKDSIDRGTATKQQVAAYKGLKSLEEMAPYIDKDFNLSLLPEVANERLQSLAKQQVEDLFVSPQGKLNIVYENNPQLKKLISDGNYVEALSSVQSYALQSVSANKDIAEFFALPYMNDADTIYETMVNRYFQKSPKLKDNETVRSIFLDSAKDTSAVMTGKKISAYGIDKELIPEVQQGIRSIKNATRRYKKVGGRLKNEEVISLVNSKINSIFKSFSSNGLSFNDIQNLSDTDSLLRGAVGLNKVFHKSMIDSYSLLNDKPFVLMEKDILPEDVTAGLKIRAATKKMASLMNQIAEKKKEFDFYSGDDVLKKELNSLSASVFRKKKEIDSLTLSLNGKGKNLGEDDYFNKVMTHVNEIFLPDKRVQEVFARGKTQPVDAKNFSYFISNKSDLADQMLAFYAGGQDVSENINKTFSFTGLLSMDRKIQKELGYNNAITTSLFRPFRNAEALINQEFYNIIKKIKSFGIEARSKESAMVHRFMEDPSFKASNEFLSLSADKQAKIADAAEGLRGIYNDLFDRINLALKKNGLPTINRREDYVTHFVDIAETLPEMISGLLENAFDQNKAAEFKNVLGKLNKVQGPKKTYFQFEFQRTGSNFTYDAIGALDKYLKPALDRIYKTDLLGMTDAAIEFAPENLANFLARFRKNAILGLRSDTDKLTSDRFKKFLDVTRSRTAKGTLLFNPNTALVQILGSPMNFALGGMRGLKSIVKMAANPKAVNSLYKNSNIRWLRDSFEGNIKRRDYFDGLVYNTLNRFSPKAAKASFKAYDAYSSLGEMSLKVFDGVAVKHAWLSAYDEGIKSGLKKEFASVYADDIATKLHSSFTKIDQPEFMNSSIAKSFFQFQTFTMNLFTSIIQDIPQIASSDSGIKATSMLLKSVAAASIANEAASQIGLYEPFDLGSLLPGYGTYRFGTPSTTKRMVDFGFATAGFLSGDSRDFKKELKNIEKSLVALTAPGARQIQKIKEASNAIQEGTIPKDKAFNAFMTGSKKVEYDIKKTKSEKKKAFKRSYGIKVKSDTFIDEIKNDQTKRVEKRAKKIKKAFKKVF